MLRYRAIRNAVKFYCPEVLGGIPMYEEMKDHFEKDNAFEIVGDGDMMDGFGEAKAPVVATAGLSDAVKVEAVEIEEAVETPVEVPVEETPTPQEETQTEDVVADPKAEDEIQETVASVLSDIGNLNADGTKKIAKDVRVSHKLLNEGIVLDIFDEHALVKFDKSGNKKVAIKQLVVL